MRLIDLDNVRIEIAVPRGRKIVQEVIGILNDSLDKLPTVDAVPVVRCKDCKWHKNYYCTNFDVCGFDRDDYCSLGERRDDADE